MRVFWTRLLGVAIIAGALTACGGGGGTSATGGPTPATPGPSGGASATPSPSPTATPAATATPTPAAQQYTGRVVDADHGNVPIAGASVSVGTSFAYSGSGYVLGNITATATSAPDGTFAITSAGAPVFIQVVAPGLVAAHRPLPTGTFILATIALPTATADELAGLAELNLHRAQYGSGQGSLPISLDADVELSARAHVQDEAAKGYYAHVAPGTTYFFAGHFVCALTSFCGNPYFVQENLDAAPGGVGNLAFADDAYITSGPTDVHFQNVVSKANLWVGFGAALNGLHDPSSPGFAMENYFAENFITSTANPSP